MAVKQEVLALLENGQRNYLSGEGLATRLGVTRAAVWKAIKALQTEGYAIEAITNRGYRLLRDSNALSATGIAALLQGDAARLRLQVEQKVTGTNALLWAKALAGEPEGRVLLAEAQTEGRGRAGRAFYSPAGTGLYFSLLLRPDFASTDTPLLTLAAAVAAAEAIDEVTGCKTQIKWVNDLLLNGKKVCGILTEGAFSLEDGSVDFAVLGVGIDLAAPVGGYPPALAETAGALYPTAHSIPAGTRTRLAAAFLNRFWPCYQHLADLPFLPSYRQRLAWVGETVTIERQRTIGESAPATFATLLGITDQCRLEVQYENGVKEALSGGEVRVRPVKKPAGQE